MRKFFEYVVYILLISLAGIYKLKAAEPTDYIYKCEYNANRYRLYGKKIGCIVC